MLFRQLIEKETSTYTYLLADENSREAILIDPVKEHLSLYKQLLEELNLHLLHALDTHVHADHITALGALRDMTGCQTYIGRKGSVACSDFSLQDGMQIAFGDYALKAFYTPGHTDDSYCFLLLGADLKAVFTGDTLLIRGSGRTDFQNGSSQDLYNSLHDVLMHLDNDTQVYPAHDYRGMTVSSIGEERAHNPRLQWDRDDFIEGMANLDLPDPKFMDVAVPANRQCGKEDTTSTQN
ncbi:MAG: Zn-dependent hydrolase [Oleiphilus sp.]|nr:MAG: Zn-dependent hydrolase [Oleiphilus sp.]